MDGQNVHSNYLVVEEIQSPDRIICRCKYAPVKLHAPSVLELEKGTDVEPLALKTWEILGGAEEVSRNTNDDSAGMAVAGSKNHITRYGLVTDKIPEWVKPGTLIDALCWEPDTYVCRDTVFKNIAGAGHLLRCGHVELTGCTYENLMTAGTCCWQAIAFKTAGCQSTGIGRLPRQSQRYRRE